MRKGKEQSKAKHVAKLGSLSHFLIGYENVLKCARFRGGRINILAQYLPLAIGTRKGEHGVHPWSDSMIV
jgi:hypothetical protein